MAYWKDKVATEAGWDNTEKIDQQGSEHKVEKVLDKRTTEVRPRRGFWSTR